MKKNIDEAVDVSSVIKGMQGNFGGDNASQAKGLQLLKGLAMSDDPKANEFMKALNTATTKISKEVLGDKSESIKEGAFQPDVARDAISKFIKDKRPMPVEDLKKLLNMISEATLTEGADAYCPNCGENNGKASEAMDDSGEVYCDNCGTSYFYESTSAKDNIKLAEGSYDTEAIKWDNMSYTDRVNLLAKLDRTPVSYATASFEELPSITKRELSHILPEAGSKTAECPDCGGKYLVQTGYCVSCKKKVGGKKAAKKKENIISVSEDVKVGDIILEKGDQIRVLEGNSSSVASKVKSALDNANFSYDNIKVTEYDVTIQLKMMAMGTKWEALEEKFYSIFPESEMNGIDIYLEGTL